MREKPVLLPAPLEDSWQWQLQARCRAAETVTTFDSEEPSAMNAAKQFCRECPVVQRCRDHAIAANEPHGVWGALTPRERVLYKWSNGPVIRRLEGYRLLESAV
ncbi:WhiB family transcriptional regulator [Rhodococcus sp. G-MC3]|uniref:WhiB family transcriptional regulator n=1 Tax=Rhodococcus sp. G-MC3 TaxID=3046209 RepID=UPI0024B9E9F2|nr:WhiB family transcriptional regulator [Rhodococcus sp. G-MC3]MDJ0396455.1 WhiB family transcriptional regulator [Rhodococcus sp. G-MC3]